MAQNITSGQAGDTAEFTVEDGELNFHDVPHVPQIKDYVRREQNIDG